jgi:hypothetical protein
MPIKPPNLDDRRYADIVREARALIPQYCPEWTNLGDADPGMTLVQLFAWMTEMTIYRLNRVPDKTYIHFLNFIGEERREARPAVVPLTFDLRTAIHQKAELPAYARCSTRASEGVDALQFLTTEPITVHDANVTRIVAVQAGQRPLVREIPFEAHPVSAKALLFGSGRGVQLFRMDPIDHGVRSYTPHHFLYVGHDDFKLMNVEQDGETPIGRMVIRSGGEANLPVGAMFRWEYFTDDDKEPWKPIPTSDQEDEVLGLPEIGLVSAMPGISKPKLFGHDDDTFAIPEPLAGEHLWIRGRVDYDRWLAHRMVEDLEIAWRDDRGGEDRSLNNWEVRATGRTLEFFVQDMPPIRGGWTVTFTLVDRSVPAGRGQYLPRYRWSYRRGDQWEPIPAERVRHQDTSVILTGPFVDMAGDGYNLRAERAEVVFARGFIPDLELEMTWLRPVVLLLAAGPDTPAAGPIDPANLPILPFQPGPTLPPLLGMKFFVGSDLFENRAERPVLVEIEIDWQLDGESIEEPKDDYALQLTYRAADTWRVVYDEDDRFAEFRFADLDPEGALQAGPRKVRLLLDPKKQLKGLHRAAVGVQESTWLRFELSKSKLTRQPDKKAPPIPIVLRVLSVKLGVDGVLGRDTYEQPMPGLKVGMVEVRPENRRLSRVVTRSAGRLSEDHPFDTFIDVDDASTDKDAPVVGHHAVYLQLDKPLPPANRHSVLFKTRGETYLPEDTVVSWEILQADKRGRLSWGRLVRSDDGAAPFSLNRSGALSFPYPDPEPAPAVGNWIRVLYRRSEEGPPPPLPPISHLMLNTVEAVNLHAFRMEKFSGLGTPHQSIQLRRFPIFLHDPESDRSGVLHPDRFEDIRVFVEEEDTERREWRRAPGNTLLTATKDDRVFIVDPVDGTLTFGNGIRGRMLPVGSYNVAVEVYHTVPGEAGNVPPGSVVVSEGYADLVAVSNLLPGTGGRNAETIDEIIRRAPSVLTSRDRAVTRLDFEIIAKEASAEVARAACDGKMGADGKVGIIILPQRREGERIPDTFLAAGLKDHVQRYLARRCLVNVQPDVRLATFQEVDVSLSIRLRPNSNLLAVRERARSWVFRFLDPYLGGLDGSGWPFGGTLYAQDFARLVTAIPEVRHVVDVQLYDIAPDRRAGPPGWEEGAGRDTLVLDRADLFILRRVRVTAEEGEG